jgi:hypothetical protein
MKKNNLAFKRPTPRFRHQGPPEHPTSNIWDIWVELTPKQKGQDISLLIGLLFWLIIFFVRVS